MKLDIESESMMLEVLTRSINNNSINSIPLELKEEISLFNTDSLTISSIHQQMLSTGKQHVNHLNIFKEQLYLLEKISLNIYKPFVL